MSFSNGAWLRLYKIIRIPTSRQLRVQAVDGPLNDKQLEFAQRQSTRAHVSRSSLSVEYHYSSFRGDVDGLIRRGYDVYLQHTNYGNREIKLRLTHGMPAARSVWSKYVDGAQLDYGKGRGGILTLRPTTMIPLR